MAQQAEPQADTRLFYIVHKALRLLTNRFADATEKLPPSTLQPVIGSRWTFYAAILHHHHHDEDDSIYPALLAVRPDLETLIKTLEEDHRQLSASIDTASAAVTTFEQEPDPPNQQMMHESIIAVRDGFFPHLDIEDAKIIPAITESVPPKEWEDLDNRALKTIPRQYLPLAVGALDAVIRSMPEQDWPPPPPLPIRAMLALSWRKKWAVWEKPLLA